MIIRPSIVLIDPTDDIQATIDALPVQGGIVQLGPGTYTITETIVFPDDRPVWLRGSGITEVDTGTGTVIHNASGTDDNDTIMLQWHNQRVSDLGLTFVSTMASGAGIGTEAVGIRVRPASTITFRNAENICIDNVWVEAAPSWGIYFEGDEVASDGRLAFDSRLERVHVRGSWHDGGILLGAGCQNIRLDHCFVMSMNVADAMCVQLLGCTTVAFNQCTIQDIGSTTVPTVTGYNVRLGTTVGGGQNINISFNQCHFEDGVTTNALTHKHFVVLGGQCDCVSFNECYFVRTNSGVRPRAILTGGGSVRGLSIRGCMCAGVTGEPYGFDDDIVLTATCYGAIVDGGSSVAIVAGAWHTYPLVVQDAGLGTLIRRATWVDPASTLSATTIPGWMNVPHATKAQLVAAVTGRAGCIAWNTTDGNFCVCTGTNWYPLTPGTVLS